MPAVFGERGCRHGNRRGEALPNETQLTRECPPATAGVDEYPGGRPAPCWHVLWTRSNCERRVHEQLAGKGFASFLPTVHRLSRNRRVQRLYRAPLFPGYLFVRHAIDKQSYLDICRTRGLVRVLGERWDRLATVADSEMEAICRVQESGLPRRPCAYLREGERVRIVSGPLADVEGILKKSKSDGRLLILSVNLLARSLAVEVAGSEVVPV